jgi:DNA-binding response OmpR family regulator/DNA-binding CsgD family transcriptional regulator
MQKVLIVEDETSLREEIAGILRFENFAVIEASNGKEGIKLAMDQNPDLILCDILMPGMDGFELFECLNKKENTTKIPFIFITALDDRKNTRKGMNLGADDYLTKPFTRAELMNTINSRIQKSIAQKNFINEKIQNIENQLSSELKLLQNEIDKKNSSIAEFMAVNEILDKQLKKKEIELIKDTFRVIEVNNTLYDLKQMLNNELRNQNLTDASKKILLELKRKTKRKTLIWNNWTIFQLKFNQTYPHFITNLTQKFPGLTQYEMVFISAHYMGLNTAQLADLLNISDGSVRKSRYRIKKKLGLKKEDDFLNFIQSL